MVEEGELEEEEEVGDNEVEDLLSFDFVFSLTVYVEAAPFKSCFGFSSLDWCLEYCSIDLVFFPWCKAVLLSNPAK